MDEGRFSISASNLYRWLGTAAAPLLIDVRRGPVFEADEWIIAGAVHRPPEEIERWGREIAPGSPVVVYCAHGREVSQGAAAILCEIGAAARYLEGGIAAWAEAKLRRRHKLSQSSASWVTRSTLGAGSTFGESSSGRGDLAARDDNEESDGEARLKAVGQIWRSLDILGRELQ